MAGGGQLGKKKTYVKLQKIIEFKKGKKSPENTKFDLNANQTSFYEKTLKYPKSLCSTKSLGEVTTAFENEEHVLSSFK